jgi:polar amino acid transport system ATP-binding protein
MRVDGLGKFVAGRWILRDVNLTVERGSTVAVIGPSGAGKSTLLRCANGLEHFDEGNVYLGSEVLGWRAHGEGPPRPLSDRAVDQQRRRVGFVFQNVNLFSHRTALQNVTEGPRYALGIGRDEAEERGVAALERVGLKGKSQRYPDALSGGEQQRVAIARALCMQPAVILFDEPTSALDPELVREVLVVLRGLSESGTTMVVVTHELGFAKNASDQVVFMEAGAISASGRTEEFFRHPPTSRIRDYLAVVGT